MTPPIVSITAAILYCGWLWHGRSAVEFRESSSKNQPTRKPTSNAKTPKGILPTLTPTTRMTHRNSQQDSQESTVSPAALRLYKS